MTTTVDLNNPEMAGPSDPSAAWKRALIVHLGKLFHIPTFVETGTCWGDTVNEIKDKFKHVWSIELSLEFFTHAAERFSGFSNVHIIFGSSGYMIPHIIPQTKGKLMFWLDAHPTGEESANNGDQIPIELEFIQWMRPDSLVLIDDVKLVDGAFRGPFGKPVPIPEGWKTKYLHGVLILHAGGYDIPNRF